MKEYDKTKVEMKDYMCARARYDAELVGDIYR